MPFHKPTIPSSFTTVLNAWDKEVYLTFSANCSWNLIFRTSKGAVTSLAQAPAKAPAMTSSFVVEPRGILLESNRRLDNSRQSTSFADCKSLLLKLLLLLVYAAHADSPKQKDRCWRGRVDEKSAMFLFHVFAIYHVTSIKADPRMYYGDCRIQFVSKVQSLHK